MKGFSYKETLAYYRSIVEQAWKQVESASTPEIKSAAFEDNLDWTMLDKDYDDRTRRTFSDEPVFLPSWWGRYDPSPSRAEQRARSPCPVVFQRGKLAAIAAGRGFRRLDGQRRTGILCQRDRRAGRLHRQCDQQNQPAVLIIRRGRQLKLRRRQLRLCVRLRRLCLRLRRRREVVRQRDEARGLLARSWSLKSRRIANLVSW